MKPYTALAVAVAVIAAFAFGALTFGQADSQATANGQEVRQLRAIATELRTLNANIGTRYSGKTVINELDDIAQSTKTTCTTLATSQYTPC